MSLKRVNKRTLMRHILSGAASISLYPNVKTETPIIIGNPLTNRSRGLKGDMEALRSDSSKISQDLNISAQKLISGSKTG